MKFTWKIWVLVIFIIFSLIWMLNIPATTSLLLLVLCVGILFTLLSVKSKVGKIFIVLLLLASLAFLIYQQTDQGLLIKAVDINSTAYEEGLRAGQTLLAVNNQPVQTQAEYENLLSSLFSTGSKAFQDVEFKTKDETYSLSINAAPKITVEKISLFKIKLGLDLQGGSRALVKPEKVITLEELNNLIAVTSTRLNVYGISDIVIRPVSDLSGNNYMLIEIAGASPAELEDLISKQGKFEGKIGNVTAFVGGIDIAHVEQAGQGAGIEGCYDSQDGGQVCRFRFPISLTEAAAKRHADITSKLDISSENPEYLSEKLDLYVDDVLMDSLYVSKDLKGLVTTDISIQGSGTGATKQAALDDANKNMKKLQTILITGSLPYKLEIVKLDTISPMLGQKFINTILLAGLCACLAVALIILLRYRKIKLSLAVLLTSFSEVFIILGIASIIKWNLDLPSIAGIIATIGTGVDQQIVILDESQSNKTLSIKERLSRALFVILGAFFTVIAAMIPLFWAGAGMLKGFALTTIIGVSVGMLITRPAFADIVKKIVD